jgi:hypothetical protein
MSKCNNTVTLYSSSIILNFVCREFEEIQTEPNNARNDIRVWLRFIYFVTERDLKKFQISISNTILFMMLTKNSKVKRLCEQAVLKS